MKHKLRSILAGLVILLGIAGLFYPSLANYLNERNSSRAVQSYDTSAAELEEAQRLQMLEEARAYNEALFIENGSEIPPKDEDGNYRSLDGYEDLLNVSGDGVMGYLTIPKLSETVLIYHGTSESVLQSGVGHIENTSLPVGGESTHAALSGHRGLPSKRLFTDLDQLEVGDVFYIKVLGETLAYQIDQILTVLPEEMEALAITEGEDYVTLVTCTPYSINTHRLLVRGTRIPYDDAQEIAEIRGTLDQPTQTNKELLIAGIVLAIYFAGRLIWGRIKKHRRKKKKEKQNKAESEQ